MFACEVALIVPAVADTGTFGCEVALIAPAVADTGMFGCEAALIAPAVADTGNSGGDESLFAPVTARRDRAGCRWHIPAPDPQVSGDKIQRIIAAINLDGQGGKKTSFAPKAISTAHSRCRQEDIAPEAPTLSPSPYLADRGNSESTSYWERPRTRRI